MIIEYGQLIEEYNISSMQFNSIKFQENRIVYFVYNMDIQRITLGDIFLLHNEENPSKTLRGRMSGAVQLPTFERLFDGFYPYNLSPDESVEEWIEHLIHVHSKKEIENYGVIGILFEKVD